MKTLRYFLLFGITGMLVLNSYAGTKVPVDATGEIVYRQSFRLQTNFTGEEVFAMLQDWFNNDASKFTCQTGEAPNGTCKNKTAVEEAFNNNQPLQSLDPSSGRLMGKGLIKYFGGASSNISALYMEYYIVLEVKENHVTATISKMKYHHFNQRTYASKLIFGWQGGKPFDSADKLENLVNSPNESRETQEVGAVVNKDMDGLFGNLKSFLQSKKALAPVQLTPNLASETNEN